VSSLSNEPTSGCAVVALPAQASPDCGRASLELGLPALPSRAPACDATSLPPGRLQRWLAAARLASRGHADLGLLALWWVAMYCPVMIFVESYCTNLFQEVDASREYNGHVEAGASLFRAAAALLALPVRRLFRSHVAAAHAVWTAAVAAGVLIMARSTTLAAAYLLYWLVMSLLQLQLCVVQAHSAQLLPSSDYASLFSILTLFSLILQAAFQVWQLFCDCHLALKHALLVFRLILYSCRGTSQSQPVTQCIGIACVCTYAKNGIAWQRCTYVLPRCLLWGKAGVPDHV
jgi:Reduced folate carrier